jgi:nitroreductase
MVKLLKHKIKKQSFLIQIMELNNAIKSRHSVRKFKEKKPDWRDIIECIDFARYAPMAGNNFTLKFIIVDEKEKIENIANACQQKFVGEAKYIVVVCSNSSRLVNAYGEKGEKFNKQQVGAAIENFLLKIEEKKLATCWVGYFAEEQIKQILKISENTEIEALFPIGYELEKSYVKREKADIDSILYFNEFKKKRMKEPHHVD